MLRMNNKRAKNGKSSKVSVGTLGGYADRCRVNLRYSEAFSIATATVAASSYVFSGNGIFDPNVTSTGGQPVNFDDFAAVYLRYRVWGSKIVVRPAIEVDSTYDGARVIVACRHTSTDQTTVPLALNTLSQPYAKFNHIQYYSTGRPEAVINNQMTTQQFLGLSDTEFQGQDDLAALVSAQPSHQWFWHVNQSNVNTATSATCYYTVTIDYDVEFWDRVDTTLDLDGKIRHLIKLKDAKLSKDIKMDSTRDVEKHSDDGFISVPESQEAKASLRPGNESFRQLVSPTLVRSKNMPIPRANSYFV